MTAGAGGGAITARSRSVVGSGVAKTTMKIRNHDGSASKTRMRDTLVNVAIHFTEKERGRFFSKIKKGVGRKKCWRWLGASFPSGHGTFRFRGHNEGAHRVSLCAHGGKITYGKPFAIHSCDNPWCVKPSHLRSGTQLENMRDRDSRNRGKWHSGDNNWTRRHPEWLARGARNGAYTHPEKISRGTDHSQHKLTNSQVRTIRRLAGYRNQSMLARRFGVSPPMIRKIILRTRWKHI